MPSQRTVLRCRFVLPKQISGSMKTRNIISVMIFGTFRKRFEKIFFAVKNFRFSVGWDSSGFERFSTALTNSSSRLEMFSTPLLKSPSQLEIVSTPLLKSSSLLEMFSRRLSNFPNELGNFSSRKTKCLILLANFNLFLNKIS